MKKFETINFNLELYANFKANIMWIQICMFWLAPLASDIVNHLYHLSGHLCCQIPSSAPVQEAGPANGLCCSKFSLFIYSPPKIMTHSPCFSETHKIIQVGRSLWSAPVQLPDQKRTNFRVSYWVTSSAVFFLTALPVLLRFPPRVTSSSCWTKLIRSVSFSAIICPSSPATSVASAGLAPVCQYLLYTGRPTAGHSIQMWC